MMEVKIKLTIIVPTFKKQLLKRKYKISSRITAIEPIKKVPFTIGISANGITDKASIIMPEWLVTPSDFSLEMIAESAAIQKRVKTSASVEDAATNIEILNAMVDLVPKNLSNTFTMQNADMAQARQKMIVFPKVSG